MATRLDKAVTREMMSRGLERGKGRERAVLVSLMPGDMIRFRLKGTRKAYECYLGHCYRLAQALTLEEDFKERMKVYNEKKKYQKGLRKPKRPMIPVSKFYFDSTKNT